MARLVRKCSKCGQLDDRTSWSSTEDAAEQGAFEGSWTCGSCAWSEFELVGVEEKAPTEAGKK